MKFLTAFFRLVRWPNLLFILLTQLLFYYCIVLPSLPLSYFALGKKLTEPVLWLLALASVLIAAGGYIINDYFDINIDRVNKPDKMVVEKVIYRRWAIIWHLVLTAAGLLLSLYVSLKTNFVVVAANVVCAALLWFYSTTFKKKLLSGNIIISALMAWTVLVLYVAANTAPSARFGADEQIMQAMQRIYKFAVLYAGFAFILSLVREVVKDIEDMEGDVRYGCNTMPIAWGVPAAKVFAGVWLVVLIGSLLVLQLYVLQLHWWWSALYCIVLLVVPLLLILRRITQAQVTADYHRISSLIKWVILPGILSMIFFRIY
ncbi:MAG TPA: geranylgeranylglycerol-phosphate geranylgeranyltransferase [Ferruginibacter sp.]|nr:geranylgeranylglycerol-phosphate geranylgeranyltransferase [Ferruginibacter sp.]HMP21898.1 geranylgeranylglycerol-phosphate geranylgeranyltransferase [Ferruginibacter sp.]